MAQHESDPHCVTHMQFSDGFADAKIRTVYPAPPSGEQPPVPRRLCALGTRPTKDPETEAFAEPPSTPALQPIFAKLKAPAEELFQRGGQIAPILGFHAGELYRSRHVQFKVVHDRLANAKWNEGDNVGAMRLVAHQEGPCFADDER